MTTLKIIGNSLCFLSPEWDNDPDYYHFCLDILGDEIIEGGEVLSRWVHHISFKNWADIHLLYEFAALIKERNPSSKINWKETMWHCELLNLMNSSFQMSHNDLEKQLDRRLIEYNLI